MILNRFILIKIFSSFVISLITVTSVLFIFSLIGNFGNNYDFNIILFLSIISSIQILFYIPLIFLFIFILVFIVKISTYNEIIVILHYYSIKKIFLIFFFFLSIFAILECKKGLISKKFDNFKTNYLEIKNTEYKVLIDNNFNKKKYTILKKSAKSENIEDINIYEINNKGDIQAIYSKDILLNNNNLLIYSYYKLFGNKIDLIDENLLINDEIIIINKNKNRINYVKQKKNFFFNLDELKIIIIIFLCELIIFMQLFDREFFNKKNNKVKTYTTAILVIFYTYLILNLELENYNIVFEILSIAILVSIITKKLIRVWRIFLTFY